MGTADLFGGAGLAAAGGAASAIAKNQAEDAIQQHWQDYLTGLMQIPDYKQPYIFPNDFSVHPNTYQIPTDIQHQLVTMDPVERAKLTNSIDQIRNLSNNKITSQTDLDRAKTMRDASQQSSAREQGVLNDLAGKGQPGLEALIRSQGAQDTAQRLQMGGLQANAAAGQERLGAGQLYSNLLQNLYNQDYQQQAKNTDITNQANVMNAERNRQVNERNTDLMNNALYYNTQQQHGNFNQNTTGQRQAGLDQLAHYQDQLYPITQQTNSIRGQGNNTADAINSGTNAGISGLSGYASQPPSGGGGGYQSSPAYYNTNMSQQMPDYSSDAWLTNRKNSGGY